MVLVIDDDPTVARLVEGLLRAGGEGNLSVKAAGTLRAGVSAAREPGLDAILLDLCLPDAVGLDTLRRFRAEVPDSPPVIVLTVEGDRATALAALREGADDFLLKTELAPNVVARCLRYAIERGRHREEVTRSRLHLAMALEAGQLGAWDWEIPSDQWQCSEQQRTLLGVDANSAPRTMDGFLAFAHPDDRENARRTMDEARATRGPYTDEFRIVRPDGSTRWVVMRGRYFYDAEGNAVRMCGACADGTERRVASVRQSESQRLEALGELAACVAHDLGNLLSMAMFAIGALDEHLPEKGAPRAALTDLELAAGQAKQLAASLLSFARQRAAAPTERGVVEPVDLGETSLDFVGFLRRLLPTRLRLVADAPAGAAWIRAQPIQIQQVLMNLVLNARDALEGEGEVRVRVEPAEAPDTRHVLEVSDNGPGIPAAFVARVFEPFYSARSDGSGAGLGLTIVKRIVESTRGTIEVVSSQRGGAAFRVHWPAAPRPTIVEIVRARGTILPAEGAPLVAVVEDDEYVRRVLVDGLNEAGFRVFDCSGAEALLEEVTSGRAHPAAVLVEWNLPGVSGFECLARLRRSGCAAPALAMSGASQVPELPDVKLLRKPFTIGEVCDAVHELLSVRVGA